MKKWEYDYKHVLAGSIIKKTMLNELGSEGWELISVVALSTSNIYYFKREKVEKVDPVDDH